MSASPPTAAEHLSVAAAAAVAMSWPTSGTGSGAVPKSTQSAGKAAKPMSLPSPSAAEFKNFKILESVAPHVIIYHWSSHLFAYARLKQTADAVQWAVRGTLATLKT